MPKPKLTYFDFPGGRGEDCRLALFISGVDFEDDRIKGSTWPERKADTPFGSLPVLEVPGRGPLAQSNVILSFIGRRHDLHPKDDYQAARHEALMAAVEDMRKTVEPTLRIKDEQEKKAAREELATGYLQGWGAKIEAQLGDGPFVAGDALNVADLKLFVAINWFAKGTVDHVSPDVFAAFPKLTRLFEAVKHHPKVEEWYARG